MTTRLIVNADDFGQSHGINQGVVETYRHGIVTSASLMVRWPAAVEAAEMMKENPKLSVGLHLDLGEWTYVKGAWQAVYEVVTMDDREQVHAEISRQLEEFRRLTGSEPTHVDSHQHVHRRAPVDSVVAAIAEELPVPIRMRNPKIRYCGRFYGQSEIGEPLGSAVSVASLVEILKGLPPGISELCCHPAKTVDFDSMYAHERVRELASLTDARVREAISSFGIDLCSFADVKGKQVCTFFKSTGGDGP